jgi:hypothetical protein
MAPMMLVERITTKEQLHVVYLRMGQEVKNLGHREQ